MEIIKFCSSEGFKCFDVLLDFIMTKVKAQYETIAVGKRRIRLKFWPAENVSYPGVPQYIGVLTRVEPEMFDKVERVISRDHKIKGIFYPKP